MHYYDVLSSMKTRPAHRKRLGNRIRAYRNNLGFSQEKLAEIMDCHRNYIGKVERGEQNLTVDMLARLAKSLKRKPSELIKGMD